jgi:SAM-dependent methyltransferase
VHQSSLDKMRAFRARYLSEREKQQLLILDLGSQDINGTYRPLFENPRWTYIGVDLTAGRNVDVVLSDPYDWSEIPTAHADLVISGQAFEHIEWFWLTMLQIGRVLKPGGLCCLICPAAGPEHRYPVDCWRFYPDGLAALARFAGLNVISVSTQWQAEGYSDGSDDWKDSMLVCEKPRMALLRYRLRHALRHLIWPLLMRP